MKKIITLFVLAVCLTAHAEFGVSGGATFNYKANFRTVAEPQGRATDPANQIYDDGHVGAGSIPGNPGLTWDYSYDQNEGAQVVNTPGGGGTLTLNSSQTILDEQQQSGQQTEAQPAIEIYWQENLTSNERWNVGLRAAFRWQRIDLDNAAVSTTTIDTLSNTYSYTGGELIFDNWDTRTDGHIGLPVISDSPTSSTSSPTAGLDFTALRELEADLFALDFGPTLSCDLTEKLRLTASIGGTVAWIDSTFSYTDGTFAQNDVTEQEWLFGAYASADLQYQVGEHWGLFGGAAYTRLEDFEQQVDGRSAELQFGDSYTLRAGFFFR